jgi:hypothetical protein
MPKSQLARRAFLGRTSQGLGAFALASMLEQSVGQAATPKTQVDRWTGAIKELHAPQKAKRVIFLCMAGGS